MIAIITAVLYIFNPFIIKWYHSFRTGRSQLVRVNLARSCFLTTNTGAPRDASVLHYCTHSTQTTAHPQPLETSLSNLQVTLQSSVYCSPIATLTHNSPGESIHRTMHWQIPWTNQKNHRNEMIFDPKSVCAYLPVVISSWSNHWTSRVILVLGYSHWQQTQLKCTCPNYALPGPKVSVSTFSGDSEHWNI